MAIIANQQPYDPTGVDVQDLIKPDVFNAELNAIAAAFARFDSLPAVTASTALSASSRNVLVDLSSLVNTDTSATITLPTSPNIGDPPCLIVVQKDGYHTSGTHHEAAAVITSTDALINGVTPDNTTFTNLIALYNPGDVAVCTYVGGDIGWSVLLALHAVSNPHLAFTSPASAAFPGPFQDSALASTAATFALAGLTLPGQSFAMANTVSGTITLGDSTYTFNGVAGPYVISTPFVRYKFTLLAALTFAVTS